MVSSRTFTTKGAAPADMPTAKSSKRRRSSGRPRQARRIKAANAPAIRP